MKAKTKAEALPTAIAPAVAKGEAELGIFLTNVFNRARHRTRRPLPRRSAAGAGIPAAVATDAKEAAAAKALIDFLKTAAAVAAIKAAGMTPG